MCLLSSPERVTLDNSMCPYNEGMTPERLAELARTARTTLAAHNDAVAARNAAIVEAARQNIPKPAVVEATGLTKEQVRRIEREGGAPHRQAGRPAKDP